MQTFDQEVYKIGKEKLIEYQNKFYEDFTNNPFLQLIDETVRKTNQMDIIVYCPFGPSK